MQEGTLTALLDMAAHGAAAAPLRPAEEIAREMVPEPCEKDGRGQILAELRDPGSTRGTVWPIFAWPGEVDDLRAFIARTISLARADGAAEALAGQQPPDLAGRIIEMLRDAAKDSEHIPVEFGERSPGRYDAIGRIAAWKEALFRAEVLAREAQPRNLASRIRALIQEYAGRWADAEPRSIERRAATGVMDDLCRALDDVRTGTGRPLTWWIELLRHPSGSMDPTIRAHRARAADELEVIVRECAERGTR